VKGAKRVIANQDKLPDLKKMDWCTGNQIMPRATRSMIPLFGSFGFPKIQYHLLPPSMQVSGNHILSNIQRNTLSKVVAKFPKFPVSPAVEKLIYAEVDRMS